MIRPLYATILLLFTLFSAYKGENESCSASSNGSGTCPAETDRAPVAPAPPSVCFVVRTYWGHGDEHGGELRSFLKSLQDQKEQK